MKRSHLIAVLVGFMAIVAFANTALAYYHPGLGRFTSRDPGPGASMATRVGMAGPAVVGSFLQRDMLDPYASNGSMPVGLAEPSAPVADGHVLMGDHRLNNQYIDGMNLYQYVRSNPVMLVDPTGEAVPIVVGGVVVTVSAAEAAAAAFGVSVATCLTIPDCRDMMVQLTRDGIDKAMEGAQAVVDTVVATASTCATVRCRFQNHGPHHSFMQPRWGIPPWKTCWQRHIQVNCWIKGKSGSNFFTARVPYGPCYKFRNGAGSVTH